MTDYWLVGIDPGLAATGWGRMLWRCGAFEEVTWGCITTSPKARMQDRLRDIFDGIVGVGFTVCEPQKRSLHMAMEKVFFNRVAPSTMQVAMARGAIFVAGDMFANDIAEFTPQQIKKAVTGSGKASKEQVQKMVARILGLKEVPKPDHAADALAAAICLCHRLKTEDLVRREEEGRSGA